MLKLLEKEKKLKSILELGEDKSKRSQVQNMIQFVKNQQETLIDNTDNGTNEVQPNLLYIFQTIGGQVDENTSNQKMTENIVKSFESKNKALAGIFTQLEDLAFGKKLNEESQTFTYKDVFNRLKSQIESAKKSKQQCNSMIKKIVQL